MAGNQSYERRLAAAVQGVPRTLARIAPPRRERQGDIIRGQSHRDGARLHNIGVEMLVESGGENRFREYRVGPMLRDAHIEAAYDFYKEGLKFAAWRCSIPPFDELMTLALEEAWVCGTIATVGQFGGAPQDALNRIVYNVGNVYAIGLPDALLYTQAEADEIVLTGARYLVQNAPDTLRREINTRCGNPDWNTPQTADRIVAANVAGIVESMAMILTAPSRNDMMSCYTAIFLAYTQQGNITQRKLEKIIADLAADQIVVIVTPDIVSTLWSKFGPYFDDGAAADFFPRWSTIMATRSLRMQLTFDQAANTGLTGLTLIRTAITLYPDFYWDRLASLCPGDWQNFLAADEAVAGDVYYGYKKRLGVVGVRNYAAIAYCAKQLHLTTMGDQNMLALHTLTNVQIPQSAAINNLIHEFTDYIARRNRTGNDRAAAAYYAQNNRPIPENFLDASAAARRRAEEGAGINPNVAELFNRLIQGGGVRVPGGPGDVNNI